MLLKASPHIDAQIHFDSDADSAADSRQTFSGNDSIKGSALFNLRKDYGEVRYKVTVKGVVETKTNVYPAGGMQSTAKTETLTFLSATLCDRSKTASLVGANKYQASLPFKFTLQNEESKFDSNWDLQTGVHELLPTINSKGRGHHWSSTFKSDNDTQYRVTYTLIASAFMDKKRIASSTRSFDFVPTASPPSPIATEDFPGEYVVRASKVLQRRTGSSRIGVISDEPPAVILHPGSTKGATNVNLLLLQFRPDSSYFTPSSMSKEVQVKAELRTTTFTMPQYARKELHTLQAAELNKIISVRHEKSHSQAYNMRLKQWECSDSDSEDEKSSSEVSTAEVSFPFTLEGGQLPAPSFFSPLLSRRYAIDLSLTFDEDPNSTMKLRLPVQIAYGADRA